MRAMQRFAHVNVAEPCDDSLIQKQRLDWGASSCEAIAKLPPGYGERLRAERRKLRPVIQFVGGHQIQRPEPPRVVERHPVTVVGLDQDMVMLLDLGRIDPPSAGHAEVKDQCVAAINVDQPIFGPPAKARDTSADQPLTKTLWHRPPKVRPPKLEPLDAAPVQHSGQATDGCLDFGKLRHAGDMADRVQAR